MPSVSGVRAVGLHVAVESLLEDGRRERALALLGENHAEVVGRLEGLRVRWPHGRLEAPERGTVESGGLVGRHLISEELGERDHRAESERRVGAERGGVLLQGMPIERGGLSELALRDEQTRQLRHRRQRLDVAVAERLLAQRRLMNHQSLRLGWPAVEGEQTREVFAHWQRQLGSARLLEESQHAHPLGHEPATQCLPRKRERAGDAALDPRREALEVDVT